MSYNVPDPLDRFIFHPGKAHSLPSFYWNVYNDEQRIKYLCVLVKKILDQQKQYIENNNDFNDLLKQLAEDFQKFQESGFDDYYRTQIEEWINLNLDSLFSSYSRGVYFGLTTDGYFCAYVPDSWNDIVFDTGANYNLNTYGRLILRMDVDSPYSPTDQKPEEIRPYTEQQIEDKVKQILIEQGVINP